MPAVYLGKKPSLVNLKKKEREENIHIETPRRANEE